MTNREKINAMANEELAALLVSYNDGSDYIDDSYWYSSVTGKMYYTSDDAEADTIDWLSREYVAPSDKCSTCANRDDNSLDGDCYACLKGIRDGYEQTKC